MLVVKIKTQIFILLIMVVSILLIYSCGNSKSTYLTSYNNSKYRLSVKKTKNKELVDSAWISINISELDQKNNKLFQNPSVITYGCYKYHLNKNSHFFKVNSTNFKSQIRITSIGFFTIETMPFVIKENDSIVIDFVLAEDDRALNDCDGGYIEN